VNGAILAQFVALSIAAIGGGKMSDFWKAGLTLLLYFCLLGLAGNIELGVIM
jgi:hypothetical protein